MSLNTRPKFSYGASESRRLLRQRTGRAHAVLAGRASAAIWATLSALDFHDRVVLIPANTCYIVLWAVLQSGNVPVLIDVDPLTGNLSPEALRSVEALKPAVVIPAHLYGIAAPMTAITDWARSRGVFVIEDAALALGGSADGRPAGAWGNASVFSFGLGKITDVGLGGALLTDDTSLSSNAERLLARLPIWNGKLIRLNAQWLDLYWPLHQFEAKTPRLLSLYPTLFEIYGDITRHRATGDAWRDLAAALTVLDANLARRIEFAALYDSRLAVAPLSTLSHPVDAALWRYPLLVPAEHRDALLEALWAAHIFDATRWYPSLQPMHAALAPDAPKIQTPVADQLAAQIINLPLSSETEAVRVIDVILRYVGTL